jgi:hypothetical protein
VALELSASDRALLDRVGRHPCLPSNCLAPVLGTSAETTRRRLDRLIARGLLRLVEPDEVDAGSADLELVELTVARCELVTARRGLTLPAVRANDLACSGPDRPVGTRRKLLENLEHTLGADAVFVSLIETARQATAAVRDGMLVER